MADDQEGWRVPQRPAFIAAVLVPLLLALGVAGAAWFYDRDLRPLHRQPVAAFPAPGVETFIHDGHGDPIRKPPASRVDPAVTAAKRATVSDGLHGWNTAP